MKRSLVPAVAYYRMSSMKQDESIPAQRLAVERYGEENGYRIVREFVDEGISGDDTERRTEFQRMISECDSGEFRAVLCWDQDRFGRFDPLEAGYWIKPMRDAGVSLVTVAQGPIDWNDFSGRISWTITQEGKHQYLSDLSRNALRGIAQAAKRGDWVSGTPPFGYTVEETSDKTKRLSLGDSFTVELVRRIFGDYLKGASLRSISMRLNTEGISSPRGKNWTASTIRSILTNDVYTGVYRWNATTVGKYHRYHDGRPTKVINGGKRRLQNDESDCIVIEDNHPAIISQDQFQAVQDRLLKRRGKSAPMQGGGNYLFTGIVRCKHCGARMHGATRDGNHYLVCSSGVKKGETVCKRYSVRQDLLLRVVKENIRNAFTSPEFADELRNEIRRQVQEPDGHSVEQLESELKKADDQLQKAKCRLLEVDADMLSAVQERIRDIRKRRDDIASELKRAKTPVEKIENEQSQLIERALQFVDSMDDVIDRAEPEQIRELFSQSIDHIECEFESKPIGSKHAFRLKGGVIHANAITESNVYDTASPTWPRR